MKRLFATLAAPILAAALAASALAQDVRDTSAGPVRVDRMIAGLNEPWAIGFLPGGGVLVTERAGRLLHVRGGDAVPVAGVPQVAQLGQGGLLDVVIARDFAQSREIFLSFAEPAGGGARTALAVARMSQDGTALENLRVIFRMSESSGRGQHFGSRIVEARDGTLFLTIGDRGDADEAQNPRVHNGKVIRVARDGSIPGDNPFADGAQALPEIWSIGHRNPQGAALDAEGRLWTVAHGARGGDEVNRPEAGRNYGWPVISFGRHYTGLRIGVGSTRAGMEQPLFYWDPSIAPSGMMIYSGRLFPEWQGDVFVGALQYDTVVRLDVDGNRLSEGERLFADDYIRIRDVREAPDGAIWFLSVGDGAAYRVTPAD
ncbi:PQQ-dependent sugar dehydrogenase [Halovulum dunhuangense]|uniref:PQQ-dependent sugar dehydrogenase n=1 Tax=Halovulum dunhuangense TaxID=1505036 RepID=A0A849L2K8_9RHOB|nr:PQQ-dependent sugar dehydrogenase [Halovulum dunhuangense]NNU80462.1 PQQ-dependent sugar dehydrogenase [Halovulum dunhuangense]